jgi:hypothetical protein
MPIAFLALFFSKLVYTSSVRIYCALFMLLGAFPVEFSVEIVLQESVDNCFLINNPLVGEFLCNTVSKLPVQTVLIASTSMMRHLKSNGFVMSLLSSAAIRESSPSKTLSCASFPKLSLISRLLSKNVGCFFFNVVLTIDFALFLLQGT